MKSSNYVKVVRTISFLLLIIFFLIISLFISLNIIVNPLIYWIASTEGIRIFIACIISWFIVSRCFDLYYRNLIKRKRIKRFNALNIPYERKFRGRS